MKQFKKLSKNEMKQVLGGSESAGCAKTGYMCLSHTDCCPGAGACVCPTINSPAGLCTKYTS